ncbi:MAG: CPBP family intramembrane metalloprotease [Bacilli bacterium]|nr:CPBP family intramembrane metalloprotease [Bacilli bacterium]
MSEKYKPINFGSTNVFKALFTTIILFIIRIVLLSMFQSVTKDTMLSNVIVYTILIIALFYVQRKELIKEFKSLGTTLKKTSVKIPLTIILFLIIEYVVNGILMKYLNALPAGQDLVQEALKGKSIIVIIYLVILTPILETLFFFYPYKSIKNKVVAFLFSTTVFALFHMITVNSAIELLFLIPYLFMSAAFSYGFFKTGNIYVSIIVHAINNIIAIVLLFI